MLARDCGMATWTVLEGSVIARQTEARFQTSYFAPLGLAEPWRCLLSQGAALVCPISPRWGWKVEARVQIPGRCPGLSNFAPLGLRAIRRRHPGGPSQPQ